MLIIASLLAENLSFWCFKRSKSVIFKLYYLYFMMINGYWLSVVY